jgi:hypothetical protein
MALGAYLESIESLCRSLDREALQQCILALASQVKAEDRQVFLQNFKTLIPDNEHQDLAISGLEESFLLSEIDNIRQEILKRIEFLDESSRSCDDDDWHRLPGNSKLVN